MLRSSTFHAPMLHGTATLLRLRCLRWPLLVKSKSLRGDQRKFCIMAPWYRVARIVDATQARAMAVWLTGLKLVPR